MDPIIGHQFYSPAKASICYLPLKQTVLYKRVKVGLYFEKVGNVLFLMFWPITFIFLRKHCLTSICKQHHNMRRPECKLSLYSHQERLTLGTSYCFTESMQTAAPSRSTS